mgnify:FL=1
MKKYQAILEVLLASIVLYIGHKLFFFFSKYNEISHSFNYSIETLYLFFTICSLILLFILIKVKEKNIDNVGHTYLLLTFIIMALSYFFLYTILKDTHEYSKIEKINFFIIFALFLATETTISIRLLNKNQ